MDSSVEVEVDCNLAPDLDRTREEVLEERKAGTSNEMPTIPTEAIGLGMKINIIAISVAKPS